MTAYDGLAALALYMMCGLALCLLAILELRRELMDLTKVITAIGVGLRELRAELQQHGLDLHQVSDAQKTTDAHLEALVLQLARRAAQPRATFRIMCGASATCPTSTSL